MKLANHHPEKHIYRLNKSNEIAEVIQTAVPDYKDLIGAHPKDFVRDLDERNNMLHFLNCTRETNHPSYITYRADWHQIAYIRYARIHKHGNDLITFSNPR